MNWIKRHSLVLIITLIVSILPIFILTEVIHYNLEPEHKIYVEWTVYRGSTSTRYHGVYDIVGDEYEIYNHWVSAGKYNGSYRSVNIVDKNHWNSYFAKQSVCIYTGLNDVEVNTIKIIE